MGLIRFLRQQRGIEAPAEGETIRFEKWKEQGHDRLVNLLVDHLDMEKIFEIIGGEEGAHYGLTRED